MKTNSLLALLVVIAFAASPCVQARKYSISDRQASLEKKIESAYKANQLTLKEADGLKDKIRSIKGEEQKMKDKNGGKLSYSDNTNLEKELNKVSEKLHKKMLEKRVQ